MAHARRAHEMHGALYRQRFRASRVYGDRMAAPLFRGDGFAPALQ
jgi:hypothetical protein